MSSKIPHLTPSTKDEVGLSRSEKMGLCVGVGKASKLRRTDDPPSSTIDLGFAHSTTAAASSPPDSVGFKAFSEQDVPGSSTKKGGKGAKPRIRQQRRTPGRPTSSGVVVSVPLSSTQPNSREFIRPRLVTIIRYGPKPRKTIRFLLNKKTAVSFDQVLNDVTSSLKPQWGAVCHMFTVSGRVVATLEDFFGVDDIFLAFPNSRGLTPLDFELDIEECKAIQPYAKATLYANKKQKTFRAVTAKAAPSPVPVDANFHFPLYILEKYEVGPVIGDGSFAVVRHCTDRKTRELHALKVIDKSKNDGKTDVPPEQEIEILSQLNHPNIIKLFQRFELGNELYLVLELMQGGDLFDNLSEVTKFPESEAKSMTKDIAAAIEYLHSLNIVHRDIKPENLLVSTSGNQNQRHLKLGDFGLALEVYGPLYTICGTPTYVAPEILAESGYGLKVDIWALGVIVYVLHCGYPPFASLSGDQVELFNRILTASFEFHEEDWKGISEQAKDIIGKVLVLDPGVRLSAKEVLEHEWFKKSS